MTDLDGASSLTLFGTLEIETWCLACEWPLLQSRMASGLVPAGPVSFACTASDCLLRFSVP